MQRKEDYNALLRKGTKHLGCFQVLAITNSAAMNIVEQVLLWYDRASLGHIPKSGIAGF